MDLTHELAVEVQRTGCDICFNLMRETKMKMPELVQKVRDQEKKIYKLEKQAKEHEIKFNQ